MFNMEKVILHSFRQYCVSIDALWSLDDEHLKFIWWTVKVHGEREGWMNILLWFLRSCENGQHIILIISTVWSQIKGWVLNISLYESPLKKRAKFTLSAQSVRLVQKNRSSVCSYDKFVCIFLGVRFIQAILFKNLPGEMFLVKIIVK
jgi:hypothetical protein